MLNDREVSIISTRVTHRERLRGFIANAHAHAKEARRYIYMYIYTNFDVICVLKRIKEVDSRGVEKETSVCEREKERGETWCGVKVCVVVRSKREDRVCVYYARGRMGARRWACIGLPFYKIKEQRRLTQAHARAYTGYTGLSLPLRGRFSSLRDILTRD